MVGFGNPPHDAALVRTVLAGDPVGLRTGRKDRQAVGARRGLVQEVGSDVLGLPRHRPADPLGRGGRAPDPMAGRFSDLAVASTNHRKTQASSTAAGGAYVLRRLTPPQTAKVQLTQAWIMTRSATDSGKADLHVFSKLFADGLERGQEAKALPGRQIGGHDDVLEFLVGHLINVEMTRQPAP